ncbi:GNAT family N-acetyltransferase [Arthrobacter sp. JSM 101049]|uniref:GNAT family N-acetyltransferase n=1 Tax=Arthrobacter sp. JSM 101049 TaxID=929097 RepID=UPI00356958D4
MEETTVRQADVRDWAALREVRLRALSEDPEAFCSTWERESAFAEDQWRERAGQGGWLLAWPGGLPDAASDAAPVAPGGVAGGVLRPGTGGCELVGMWVAPASRGSGLGAEIITAVAGWARRTRAGRLDLWVIDGNSRARAFYRRQGFLETGEAQEPPGRPGEVEIGMTLPLI